MEHIKKVLDRLLAGAALLVLAPVMLAAAIGIKLSDRGPVFYRAQRMGRDMTPYTMYKFRTMRAGSDREGAITSAHDSRVFPWGGFLRKTKIDELPQLINILTGTMSIVGPRPEDVGMVREHYSADELRTLKVLPGLASPGSIFNYTHGERLLEGGDADRLYVERLLHVKLALDLYYLDHWSLLYDVKIVFRTLYAVLLTSLTSFRIDYPLEYRMVFGEKDKEP